MAVNLSPVGGAAAQFFDNSGNVLTGGKIYTYLAGTTTPAVTYTSVSGVTAHSNPIVLNAAGRVPDSGEIWLTDSISYKFVLKDQNDVLIATYDNLVGINSNFVNFTGEEETQAATQGQTVFTLTTIQYTPGTNNLLVFVNGSKQVIGDNYVETSSTVVTFVDGLNVGDVVDFCTATPINTNVVTAAQVAYDEGDVGAVIRSVESRLRDFVSVKDFGAVGDGTTDDTDAIDTAITSATGKTIYFPSGTYLVSNLVISVDTCIVGQGKSTTFIKRSTASTAGDFINVAASICTFDGLTVDGNKANCTTGSFSIHVEDTVVTFAFNNSRSTGAKANAGYGYGLLVDGDKTATSITILNSEFDNNEAFGCAIQASFNSRIANSLFTLNGADGLFVNNYDQTFTQKDYDCSVVGNTFTYNTNSGCVIGNYLSNNDIIDPIYGIANQEVFRVAVSGNTASYNGYYGIAACGAYMSVTGNACCNNSTGASQTGGILATAFNSIVSSNIVNDNAGFGIDAGGFFNGVISSNSLFNNNEGINLESSVNVNVVGNTLISNGSSIGGRGIYVNRYGGATSTFGFNITTANINIEANYFYISGTGLGVVTGDNPENVSIVNNSFNCAIPATQKFNCIRHIAATGLISGNNIINSDLNVTIDVNNILVVPDGDEYVSVTNAGSIQGLETSSYNYISTGIAYCNITNGGSGYVTPPAITFVGGTGTGATANAIINTDGVLTGIRMNGIGFYSVPPTVSIDPPPSGTTATATVQWKLPLLNKKKIQLLCTLGDTVVAAGVIPVNKPGGGNVTIPAFGIAEFTSTSGEWFLSSKNF